MRFEDLLIKLIFYPLRKQIESLRRNFHIFRGAIIEKEVRIGKNVKISHPENIVILKKAIINDNCIISSFGGIKIGENVQIGPYCCIYDSDHEMPLYENKRKTSQIEIEKGTWIGCNAIILKGVKIGENSIVGAGSVVTKNVPKNSIVAGNPAKIIKKLKVVK